VSGVDPQTRLASGFFSTTTPQSTGLAGDINVKAANLELLQGGVISSQSQGTGRSGSIVLALSDRLTARDGQILTSSTQSTGGAITITAKDIRLSRNSDITTSVFSGEGGGGNISLAARSIVLLDDSDILAFSRDGRGGNITLETPVFFAFRFQPAPPGTDPATLDGNGRVDINASGRLSAGIIALPDINELQSTVTELPAGLVDTNSLIASSCIARQARQGSFVVTGAGGFPTMPDDLASAPFPTYEIVPGPAAVARTPRSTPAIAEIDGVYRLGNGEIILGRACR
jgi:large exoprotein involved in heme utilization and adhesion